MSELKWEDPPPQAKEPGRKSRLHVIAAALKDRPGSWAKLEQSWDSLAAAKVYASGIRFAKSEAWAPKGAFDAIAGEDTDKPEKFAVWVKFVTVAERDT
jgi:hypothetical protein